jgi:hypothetical protein
LDDFDKLPSEEDDLEDLLDDLGEGEEKLGGNGHLELVQ